MRPPGKLVQLKPQTWRELKSPGCKIVAGGFGSGLNCAMPIYEFHCAGCEKDSEILVRSTDWKGAKCPHCGSDRLDKKFSTFASSSAGGGENFARPKSGGGGGCGGCCGGGPHRH